MYVLLEWVGNLLVPVCIFAKADEDDVSWDVLLGHLRAVKIELNLEN